LDVFADHPPRPAGSQGAALPAVGVPVAKGDVRAALEKATFWLHIGGMSMDAVFRALADPIRRELLDSLHVRNGQTLNELCEGRAITRQAVTKHLAVLEEANLVVAMKRGRERLHYLNAVPIHEIGERWIGKYQRAHLRALGDLKRRLEGNTDEP
jgi:DNA-binding transcriptional ArsR family regulator